MTAAQPRARPPLPSAAASGAAGSAQGPGASAEGEARGAGRGAGPSAHPELPSRSHRPPVRLRGHPFTSRVFTQHLLCAGQRPGAGDTGGDEGRQSLRSGELTPSWSDGARAESEVTPSAGRQRTGSGLDRGSLRKAPEALARAGACSGRNVCVPRSRPVDAPPLGVGASGSGALGGNRAQIGREGAALLTRSGPWEEWRGPRFPLCSPPGEGRREASGPQPGTGGAPDPDRAGPPAPGLWASRTEPGACPLLTGAQPAGPRTARRAAGARRGSARRRRVLTMFLELCWAPGFQNESDGRRQHPRASVCVIFPAK